MTEQVTGTGRTHRHIVGAARMRYRRAVAQATDARRAERLAKKALVALHLGSGPDVVVPQDVVKATRAEVTAAAEAHHFVRAPYVAMPSLPTGLTAVPADTQVALRWAAVPDAVSYRIFRDGAQVGSGPAPAFLDTSLANGTPYSYTIRAINGAGWPPLSEVVNATPGPALPDVPVLTATPGDGQVTLAWTSSTLATSYRIARDGVAVATTTGTAWAAIACLRYRHRDAGRRGSRCSHRPQRDPGRHDGGPQLAASYRVYRGGSMVGSLATTSFTDLGLTNGSAYSYTVVAVNATGSSVASASVIDMPVAAAPAAPTGPTAVAGNTQVTLSWSAVANATTYRVYRNGVQVATPTGTGWTHTALTDGATYLYYVTAVDTTTQGAASSTVTATPAASTVNGTFTGATTAIAQGHGTLRVAIVAGSSATIVRVSGASLTWAAYTSSLRSALTRAGL